MENILKISQLNKSYTKDKQTYTVLKNLNLSVMSKEFISLMGKSGCGKSTLLYLIDGIDKATSGEIIVCGKNIAKLSENEKAKMRRTEVGFIFQFYNLVQNLSVRDNILLPLIMNDEKVSRFQDKFDELVELVQLKDKLKKHPYQLSGGEQQRVAIARALITSPKLILADEPTGNLDWESSVAIMNLFQSIHKSGTTILQVTHSKEMASYSEKILFLNNGNIEE